MFISFMVKLQGKLWDEDIFFFRLYFILGSDFIILGDIVYRDEYGFFGIFQRQRVFQINEFDFFIMVEEVEVWREVVLYEIIFWVLGRFCFFQSFVDLWIWEFFG